MWCPARTLSRTSRPRAIQRGRQTGVLSVCHLVTGVVATEQTRGAAQPPWGGRQRRQRAALWHAAASRRALVSGGPAWIWRPSNTVQIPPAGDGNFGIGAMPTVRRRYRWTTGLLIALLVVCSCLRLTVTSAMDDPSLIPASVQLEEWALEVPASPTMASASPSMANITPHAAVTPDAMSMAAFELVLP
jgi:hypothetical protein